MDKISLFHVCFTLKIINCNAFHSDLIGLFEKLDKNIEIGNNGSGSFCKLFHQKLVSYYFKGLYQTESYSLHIMQLIRI
jgi:hypothetical protein